MTLDGVCPVDIATSLGMDRKSIFRILRSPAAQHELSRRREERASRQDEVAFTRETNARIELDAASGKAAKTQVSLLDSEDEKIKQKAAMDILDRTGFARVERRENVSASIVLDEAGLARLLEANKSCFPNEPIELTKKEA